MSLKKLFQIGRNKSSQVVDNLVESSLDIRREGSVLIKDLDKKINTLTASITETQTHIQLNESKVKELAKDISHLENSLRELVKDETKKKESIQLLTLINSLKSNSEAYQSSTATLQPVVDEVVSHILTLKAEALNLKDEILRLDMEQKTYAIKQSLLGSTTASDGVDITYLRESVSKAKAKFEATDKINSALNLNSFKTTSSVSSDLSLEEQLNSYR